MKALLEYINESVSIDSSEFEETIKEMNELFNSNKSKISMNQKDNFRNVITSFAAKYGKRFSGDISLQGYRRAGWIYWDSLGGIHIYCKANGEEIQINIIYNRNKDSSPEISIYKGESEYMNKYAFKYIQDDFDHSDAYKFNAKTLYDILEKIIK